MGNDEICEEADGCTHMGDKREKYMTYDGWCEDDRISLNNIIVHCAENHWVMRNVGVE